MRAIETGRWLLRSTNTGISALVNHKGEIVKRVPVNERTTFTAVAERRTGETLYMQIGIMPLLILVFGLAGLALILHRKQIPNAE
jgi:apolipoprotein N-acyltransferase